MSFGRLQFGLSPFGSPLDLTYYENVVFYVETHLGAAVPFVQVTITDSDGLQRLGGGVSNSAGRVDVSLPPGTYRAYLGKLGVQFVSNPLSFEVRDTRAPAYTSNEFSLRVLDYSLPASEDPNLCRLSGTFYDISGTPVRDMIIKFLPLQKPQVVGSSYGGIAITDNEVTVRTNNRGYVEVYLIRGGTYIIQSPSLYGIDSPDNYNEITIPDAPSWNLIDLLFVRPTSIEFTVDPVVLDLSLDQPSGGYYTIYMSNGTTCLSGGQVLLNLEDESVAELAVGTDDDGNHYYSLKPLEIGSTKILASLVTDIAYPPGVLTYKAVGVEVVP